MKNYIPVKVYFYVNEIYFVEVVAESITYKEDKIRSDKPLKTIFK